MIIIKPFPKALITLTSLIQFLKLGFEANPFKDRFYYLVNHGGLDPELPSSLANSARVLAARQTKGAFESLKITSEIVLKDRLTAPEGLRMDQVALILLLEHGYFPNHIIFRIIHQEFHPEVPEPIARALRYYAVEPSDTTFQSVKKAWGQYWLAKDFEGDTVNTRITSEALRAPTLDVKPVPLQIHPIKAPVGLNPPDEPQLEVVTLVFEKIVQLAEEDAHDTLIPTPLWAHRMAEATRLICGQESSEAPVVIELKGEEEAPVWAYMVITRVLSELPQVKALYYVTKSGERLLIFDRAKDNL
jgi:hypothetical protein